MNVLVLSNLYPPDFIGGYEVACLQVVDGLRARGHEVRVLTSAPRQPVAKADHVLRRLRLSDEWNPNAMGLFSVSHLMTHARSRFIDAHNVHELTEVVEEFRPDVAYLTNLVGVGGLGLVAALQHLGVPWVWQLGDSVPALLCTGRSGPYPGLAAEFSRESLGSFISVSENVQNEIEASGVSLNGPVALLPNWITGVRPVARTTYYRGGRLRVMSAGSVNRDKGIGVLIDAAARLRGMGVEGFSVDVYGKVGDPSLSLQIREEGLDGFVTLKGPLPHAELIELYGEYDVFAFPTFEREPFGLVPLEAAARGCVPLMTRKCGVAEWLVHGVHCLKAARTPEAFAQALHDVATGTTILEPIARRASEAVWREFHLGAVIPKIEAVLSEAARPGRGANDRKSAAELYRMARMAEQLAEGLIEEAMGV